MVGSPSRPVWSASGIEHALRAAPMTASKPGARPVSTALTSVMICPTVATGSASESAKTTSNSYGQSARSVPYAATTRPSRALKSRADTEIATATSRHE